MEYTDQDFDNETFKEIDFSSKDFSHSKFTDCNFENCNLSNVTIDNTKFQNTKFDNCKIMGINFSKSAELTFSPEFENSIISTCSFSASNGVSSNSSRPETAEIQ